MPKFRERLRLDKLSSAASTAIDVVVDVIEPLKVAEVGPTSPDKR